MKLLFVVGARPNFMKVAPILRAVAERDSNVQQILVHTGQHFDAKMSDVFFDELGLPTPDEHLGISGGSHAEQTARIMLAFEPILLKHRPNWLVVVGDVNSTVACSLVATKLRVKIAHVEAGLRSGDMSMPEEVNRRITDAISDLLLTPSPDGDANLLTEGVSQEKIICVGNVMIDSLVRALPTIERQTTLTDLLLNGSEYVLATLHRPSNVDNAEMLSQLIGAINVIAQTQTVLFPAHPRTRQRLHDAGINVDGNVRLMDPLGYFDFMAVMRSAKAVITDSGGVQEETTYLGVPCLTVRPNTERPITIDQGTNRLVTPGREPLLEAWTQLVADPPTKRCPALWDGRAAHRIAEALLRNE